MKTATWTLLAEWGFVVGIFAVDAAHGWPFDETISEQVYGAAGLATTLLFGVHALSLLGLGLLRKRPFLYVGAAGMVLAAVFPTEAGTLGGGLHVLGAVLAFGAVAATAWQERRDLPLVLLGLLVVVGTVAMAAATPFGFHVGIFERVQMVLNGAWITVAAMAPRVFSSQPKSATT